MPCLWSCASGSGRPDSSAERHTRRQSVTKFRFSEYGFLYTIAHTINHYNITSPRATRARCDFDKSAQTTPTWRNGNRGGALGRPRAWPRTDARSREPSLILVVRRMRRGRKRKQWRVAATNGSRGRE